MRVLPSDWIEKRRRRIGLAPQHEILLRDMSLVFFFYACASYILYVAEDWNLNQSVYFISSTVSTVGYGDLHPTTNLGMVFTCLVMLFGVTLIFTTIRKYVNTVHRFVEREQRRILRVMGLHLTDADALPIYRYSPADVHRVLNYAGKYCLAMLPLLMLLFFAFGVSKGVIGLTMIQSLYFTLSSCTTVGYGDFSADDAGTRAGATRAFFSVFLVVLCVVMSNTVHEMLLISVRRRIRSGESRPDIEAMLLRKARLNPRSMTESSITESEYIVEALLNDNLVDRQVLLAIRRQYHWTSCGGDGNRSTISAEDLYEHQKNERDLKEQRRASSSAGKTPLVYKREHLLRRGGRSFFRCLWWWWNPRQVIFLRSEQVIPVDEDEDDESPSPTTANESYDDWYHRYWVPRVDHARSDGLASLLARADTDPFTVDRRDDFELSFGSNVRTRRQPAAKVCLRRSRSFDRDIPTEDIVVPLYAEAFGDLPPKKTNAEGRRSSLFPVSTSSSEEQRPRRQRGSIFPVSRMSNGDDLDTINL